MRKATQVFLLLFAIGALIATGVAFYRIVLAATIHGAPIRFVDIKAGVYPLKVAFYADPINAGDVIPFAIASTSAQGKLHYIVTATPGPGVSGSLTQGDINDQQSTPYGTPGSMTFVTRGDWTMHIAVSGPSGQAQADIPIVAASPSVIPAWLAWNIGLLPLYGLLIFWGTQIVRKRHAQIATPGADMVPQVH